MNEHQNRKLREQVVVFLEKIGIDVSYKRFTTDNVMIRCPFAKLGGELGGHKHTVDTQPSLGIKIGKKGYVWHCFTCGRAGKSFINLIEKLNEHNLLEEKVNGYELQNALKVEFPDYYEQYEVDKKNERNIDLSGMDTYTDYFIKYNERRGIEYDTMLDVDLMFNQRTHQVIFPCYTYGDKKLVGHVEHHTNGRLPKYKNEVDPRDLLYLEWLIKGRIGIAVEGMYDAVKVYQHLKQLDLLDTYSAVGMFGSETSSGQITKMAQVFDRLIVMGDNDKAGIKMEKSIYKFLRHKIPMIYRIEYAGKDPDEVGLEQFEQVLKKPLMFNAIHVLD